jgi:hypothetical protein
MSVTTRNIRQKGARAGQTWPPRVYVCVCVRLREKGVRAGAGEEEEKKRIIECRSRYLKLGSPTKRCFFEFVELQITIPPLMAFSQLCLVIFFFFLPREAFGRIHRFILAINVR